MGITIDSRSLEFLNALSKNNNRLWFEKNKSRYTEAQENIKSFAGALMAELNKHDHIEAPDGASSLNRIYKDVRFSRDKTPYHGYWSGGFKRATKYLRGGYYFRIEPGKSFLAGGFRGPESHDMKRIRQDIDLNYEKWQELLGNKTIQKTFGELKGKQLQSAPRGYANDHPAIKLLRYKQFVLTCHCTDAEVLSPGFLLKANTVFKKMRPFFDYMSEVLTTDLNGVSIFTTDQS